MRRNSSRQIFLMTQALFFALACAPVALGQDPQITQLNAPPPIKAIPKEERAQIEEAKDPKNRLKITIDLSNTHLGQAEKYTAQPNYEAASREVGMYHALIENALTFLASLKRESNKTRDLYKRLEMSLRADGPRLTSMRRTTPLEFAVRIKEVEDFAREGRTEALNSFYGHTVVRDDKSNVDKPNEKPKESPTPKVQQP
jgi:hypothetical protein